MKGYLSFTEIRDLIQNRKPPLVSGFDDYQVIPAVEGGIAEGPCIEVRIGKIFNSNEAEIPVLDYDYPDGAGGNQTIRYAPKVNKILDYTIDGIGTDFILNHNESMLVETIESINLPNEEELSILTLVEPRFSLSRMGILTLKSDADPGYQGHIILRIVNIGPYKKVQLALGARIAKLRFINVAGSNPSYTGKFGGKPGDVLEKR